MAERDGGIALSRSFFHEVVAPLVKQYVPEVRYAAARVGPGSDVLGLDDAMSQDHDWGLRLQLFVTAADCGRVQRALDEHLPVDFRGRPVRFGFSADPTDRVRIDVLSVDAFAERQLGFDPRGGASVADWLSLTGQAALEVVSGAVFEDQTGELTALRDALAWYPDDLWRYVVACDWQRIDHELPIMGRAGERGDELGSRLVAARLVGLAVHLGFVLCRSWPPYAKWRGTEFARLAGCADIAADLARALDARDWHDRQVALADALTGLARLQHDSGLPAPQSAVEPFWDRPYLRVHGDLAPRLLATVRSPAVRALPTGVGTVEQQTDNVGVLTVPRRRHALARTLLGDLSGTGANRTT
jgi:hypothetical protein